MYPAVRPREAQVSLGTFPSGSGNFTDARIAEFAAGFTCRDASRGKTVLAFTFPSGTKNFDPGGKRRSQANSPLETPPEAEAWPIGEGGCCREAC